MVDLIDKGFSGCSDSKESPCSARDLGFISGSETCSARDLGFISGSERSPGERNGYQHQYSCLENSMDRGAWGTTVHGVAELDTAEQLKKEMPFEKGYGTNLA